MGFPVHFAVDCGFNILDYLGMDNLRTRYKNVQTRLANMKGSYKAVGKLVGRSKSWVSMFANNQLDDVGILLIADIEEALNKINPNNNKQPAAILAPQADSCEPHTGADAGEAFLICSTENNRAEMDCSALQDTDDFMGTGNERFPIR